MEELMLEAFKIISEAGNASALFLKAVAAAENECFEEAEVQLHTGNESLVAAPSCRPGCCRRRRAAV